jgi:hypothetical protein
MNFIKNNQEIYLSPRQQKRQQQHFIKKMQKKFAIYQSTMDKLQIVGEEPKSIILEPNIETVVWQRENQETAIK